MGVGGGFAPGLSGEELFVAAEVVEAAVEVVVGVEIDAVFGVIPSGLAAEV